MINNNVAICRIDRKLTPTGNDSGLAARLKALFVVKSGFCVRRVDKNGGNKIRCTM